MRESAAWSRLAKIALLAIAVAPAGCGDLLQEPDTGTSKLPVRLEEVSGNGQTGTPGAPLPEPVRVRVLTDGGPGARLWVEWSVIGGSGKLAPRNAFSDEDGIAETTWILGPEVGPQKIQAFVSGGLPMIFDATAGTD